MSLSTQVRAIASDVCRQLGQRSLREPARRGVAGGDEEEAGPLLRRGVGPAEENTGGMQPVIMHTFGFHQGVRCICCVVISVVYPS